MNDKKGQLVVISGPSGTGKGTVIKEILNLRPDIEFSVSATTRPPRSKEVNGREYIFIDRDEFENMISDDAFLEWAEYVGNYYGTPKIPIDKHINSGKTVLLDIEIQGAKQVMQKVPDAITIFIAAPDTAELEARLRGRGTDNEAKLTARLERAEIELAERHNYNHVVVNDLVSRAVNEIFQIIDRKD